MKEIQLYRNKGTVIVDDEDYGYLSQYRWHLDHGYASMTIKKPKPGVIYMHRLINETPTGLSTDHINGNKLDNRRKNLRICTQAQNNANARMRRDNTSGVRGVVWHKRLEKWQAQITVNGKCLYLGMFVDMKDAIEARRKAARDIHGDFANVHL